jgi:anti-sigma factor RsiW
MNSMECFKNDAELCSYLDGEIFGARESTLDSHIIICVRCSKRLLVWRQIKSLVCSSISSVKAPIHMEKRIGSLVSRASSAESSRAAEKTTRDTEDSADRPFSRDRFSHGEMVEPPVSSEKASNKSLARSSLSGPDRHVDDH